MMKKNMIVLILLLVCSVQAENHEKQNLNQEEITTPVDFSQFNLDESDEFITNLKAPSQAEIYARQVGIVLYFKYLDTKESLSSWRDYLDKLFNRYFYSKWA